MATTIYKPVNGLVLKVVNCVIILSFIVAIFFREWPAAIILGLLNILFLWIWLDTYYIIKDDQLFYKNAFIRGAVPINSIREIERHNKGIVMVTTKASTALTGLIIKFNRWDDLFVSPQNQDGFIAELQKINPEIKVR